MLIFKSKKLTLVSAEKHRLKISNISTVQR